MRRRKADFDEAFLVTRVRQRDVVKVRLVIEGRGGGGMDILMGGDMAQELGARLCRSGDLAERGEWA